MKTSVIVTTYNRPDALAAVLEGLLCQSDRDFEVIVTDDGSTSETKITVGRFQERDLLPLRHVWQDDQGFRDAAIRNQAVAPTTDYIIFIDGDCVPSYDFVRAHKRLAEPGYFGGGDRVLLSPGFTEQVNAKQIPIHLWDWQQWLGAWTRGEVNSLLPLIGLPNRSFRKWSSDRWEGIKTGNLYVWRRDLIRVNGLDEQYQGWGLEDSDLVIRLLHAGVKHKSARLAASVFHLWHKEQDRQRIPDNRRRLEGLLRFHNVRADVGLDRYGVA